jgi:hypothetical protein
VALIGECKTKALFFHSNWDQPCATYRGLLNSSFTPDRATPAVSPENSIFGCSG